MSETKLSIRTFGDPVLRQKAKAVKGLTEGQRSLLSRMAQVMYQASGIGLAAPQVGISQAMIVVDIGNGLFKLVNPKITQRSGSQEMEEGCLSVPGVCIKVKRSGSVTVDALNEEGKPVKIEAQGLFACVLQHEIDHLKGKVIVDYASFFEKLKIKHKLETLKKAYHENMPESETKSCKLQL